MKKMGNIRETPNFMTIWESEQAQQVRDMVRKCPKNCWMVGTCFSGDAQIYQTSVKVGHKQINFVVCKGSLPVLISVGIM